MQISKLSCNMQSCNFCPLSVCHMTEASGPGQSAVKQLGLERKSWHWYQGDGRKKRKHYVRCIFFLEESEDSWKLFRLWHVSGRGRLSSFHSESVSWLRALEYTAIGIPSLLMVRRLGTTNLGVLYGWSGNNLVFLSLGGKGVYHQLCLGSLRVEMANFKISSSLRNDNLGRSSFIKFAS